MVFGWGNKKPEQSVADTVPEIKQITLANISDIIEEIRSIRSKTMVSEVKTFRNKINSHFKTILNIATDLKDDNLKMDDMDPHLMRLVKRGKNEVTEIIKRETAITLPEIDSFEEIKVFTTISSRILKKIGDALGRQSHVIHIFAKKYANKLKSDLKVLTDENDENFIMELNAMIASSQLKLGNIDIAKKEFLIVQNWFDKIDMNSINIMSSYYIGYSLFHLNQYFGNSKAAEDVLHKAYNTLDKEYVKKYLDFKNTSKNDKFELAKYFWIKDIAYNYQRLQL